MNTRFTIGTLLWIATLIAVAIASYMAGYQQGDLERTQRRWKVRHSEWVVSKPIDIQLYVVDAETQEPIKGAKVSMTLVSGWGDGGYSTYVTDANGSITTNEPLCVGNYQIEIIPPADSIYVPRTYLSSAGKMLNIKKDGTYSPNTFDVQHNAIPNDGAGK